MCWPTFNTSAGTLLRSKGGNANARISEVVEAIQKLAHSSQIGRNVKDGEREMVTGRNAHSYVAL